MLRHVLRRLAHKRTHPKAAPSDSTKIGYSGDQDRMCAQELLSVLNSRVEPIDFLLIHTKNPAETAEAPGYFTMKCSDFVQLMYEHFGSADTTHAGSSSQNMGGGSANINKNGRHDAKLFEFHVLNTDYETVQPRSVNSPSGVEMDPLVNALIQHLQHSVSALNAGVVVDDSIKLVRIHPCHQMHGVLCASLHKNAIPLHNQVERQVPIKH